MFELFKQLVSKQAPDFILDLKTSHFEQLYAATCKFSKGGKYYAAVTFYTETWISSDPYGPLTSGVYRDCKELADVASITEFSSSVSCNAFPAVTTKDLESFVSKIKLSALRQFDDLFRDNQYGDRIQSKLLLAPMPSVVITVKNGDNLIGTIMLLLNGVVYPVFACSSRLITYVQHMQNLIRENAAESPKLSVNRMCLPDSVGGDL